MSLIHWWPLNGNLKDYGTLNSSLTNINSTATNNSGKIGKCYYFNGSNNALRAEYPNTTKPTSALSLAGWYKSDSGNSQHYIVSCYESGGAGLAGQDTIKFQVYSSGAYSNVATSLPDTNWHHWCGTFDGRYLKLYMDGVLKATTDMGSGTHTITYHSTTCWMMGANPYNDSPTGNYTKGYINDVRIYDHALSVKEVKEISKGLVLHYTFEDAYAEGTTNRANVTSPFSTCYNGSKSTYGWGSNTDMYKEYGTFQGKQCTKVRMGTSGQAAWPFPFFDNANPNTTSSNTYNTLSFDYYTTSVNSLLPYSYRNGVQINSYLNGVSQGGATIRNIPLNQWNHIVIVYKRTTDDYPNDGCGYVRIGTSAHTSTTTDYWLFANVQSEYKDHATPFVNGTRAAGKIYDSSGYGRSATPVNNPQILNDSSSGLHCVDLTNASNGYYDLGTGTFNFITSGTVCFWAKYSDSNYKMILGASDSGSKCLAANTPNGSSSSGNWYGMVSTSNCYCDGEVYSKPKIDSQWHFYCFTGINFSGWGDLKYFLCIYANNPNNSFQFHGYLADFKIYATTLSASDILAEYNRKAAIDRNGNVFTGEFISANSKINIDKNNTISSTSFFEGDSKTKLFGGYTQLEYIETNANQIINTGVDDAIGLTIDCDMEAIGDGKRQYWFGSTQGPNGGSMMYNGIYNNTGIEFNWLTVSRTASGRCVMTQRLSGENYIITMNNETFIRSKGTTAPTGKMYIFGCNGGSRFYGSGLRCYYFTMYGSDGSLVRNFIPAKRNKDNVIGMFDLVEGKFYTNAGTGSFTAGPELGELSLIHTNQLIEY